jgi:pimeloyl-ACP methyl ester carboxylesterase
MGSRYRADDDEIRAAKARELDRLAAHFGNDSPQYRSAIVDGESSRNQSLAVARSRDRMPLLPQVTAPTLVVNGDEDPFFPIAHGRRLAELIPGATFVAIEGLGHTPPPPPQLAQLLLDHIARAG